MTRLLGIIFCALALVGCDEAGEQEADAAPAVDVATAPDHPVADAPSGDLAATASDARSDILRDQYVQPPDTGKSCGSCAKNEICVYFVNDKSCKVFKAQCKHRGAKCYSTLVNPCATCETEVCGLWYTSTAPAACAMPMDGGLFPGFFCYCYAK